MPKRVPAGSPFGARLADVRRARGLTQAQLADAIASSRRAVSRYETVAAYPPTAVLVEIARALDVSADELLGPEAPRATRRQQEDPEIRRLWKRFQQVIALPEKDQRAVTRLVISLVAAQPVRRRAKRRRR